VAIVVPVAIAGSAFARAKMPGTLCWQGSIPLLLVTGGIAYCAAIALSYLPGNQAADVSAILNTYREMHWESGLSLIPTALFLLLALQIWGYKAGQGVALCECAPPLPTFANNESISRGRSEEITGLGRPFPWVDGVQWMWLMWIGATCLMAALLRWYGPFIGITSLEPHAVTRRILWLCFAVTALMLLDVFQFCFLWGRLKSLLRSVEREQFKRSFVPIQQFDWRTLWSFGGAALPDRRATEAAQVDCVVELAEEHGLQCFTEAADGLKRLRKEYSRVPLTVDAVQHRRDRQRYCELIANAGTEAARILEKPEDQPRSPQSRTEDSSDPKMVCQCKDREGRFSEERDEVLTLQKWQQTAERLVCLLFIGLIQTVVARLHGLLISAAAMFSFVALAIAIYPFAPTGPLAAAGLSLLAIIALAFFNVFSGMDTDPVLARIVNGDDRKLEWSFYRKFAESMALPLLALASALLPGGASRLLELVRVCFSHGQ